MNSTIACENYDVSKTFEKGEIIITVDVQKLNTHLVSPVDKDVTRKAELVVCVGIVNTKKSI